MSYRPRSSRFAARPLALAMQAALAGGILLTTPVMAVEATSTAMAYNVPAGSLESANQEVLVRANATAATPSSSRVAT